MTKQVIHRPSGSMCKTCMHAVTRNCSHLPFTSMKPIRTDPDGIIVVRCSDHRRLGLKTEAPNEAHESGLLSF